MTRRKFSQILLLSPVVSLCAEPTFGLTVQRGMKVQRVHAQASPNNWCGESRCAVTPNGDLLLMFTAGTAPYGARAEKVNDMISYRSSDRGETWHGPEIAWKIPYNQHGFVPLVPRGSKTLYAFGTEPIFGRIEDRENAPIGHRISEDDGRSWSGVTLIRPVNDPDYLGMSQPRFVLANANEPAGPGAFSYSVSYVDAIAQSGRLHLFISHQFRQVLQVTFPEALLQDLPTRHDLTQGAL